MKSPNLSTSGDIATDQVGRQFVALIECHFRNIIEREMRQIVEMPGRHIEQGQLSIRT